MATPYPWRREKNHDAILAILEKVKLGALMLGVFATIILGPVGALVGAYSYRSYLKINDTYKRRPALMAIIGLMLSVIVYGLFKVNPPAMVVDLFKKIGTGDFSPGLLLPIFAAGAPLSLLLLSFPTFIFGWSRELSGRRYLNAVAKRKKSEALMDANIARLTSGDLDPDVLEVGVVIDDVIPWRKDRVGMMAGTKMSNLKHGYILGANGTGKTVFAMNLIAEYVDAGYSIVFPDFKGDLATQVMLASIAKEHDVPFYSFWSDRTDTRFNYDGLDNTTGISPASIVITAFDFPTDGDSSYYTNQSEKYLALQFEADEQFNLRREDESSFDFLLRTIDPATLIAELRPALGSADPQVREAANAIAVQVNSVKRSDLSKLEANLSKMVTMLGPKMRPNGKMINFHDIAAQRGIVYFGIPSGGDKILMRALGSLIIRDLVSFTSERHRSHDEERTPVLVAGDEFTQLGEKADALLEILTQGRAAGVYAMVISQTFGGYSDVFVRELLGNSPTAAIMRVSDQVTAQRVSESFGFMPARVERRNISSSTDAFGNEHLSAAGGGMNDIGEMPRITADQIMHLNNQEALIHFPESPSQATVEAPSRARVKDDQIRLDIPRVGVISREYILESMGARSTITSEMIARTHEMLSPTTPTPTPAPTPALSDSPAPDDDMSTPEHTGSTAAPVAARDDASPFTDAPTPASEPKKAVRTKVDNPFDDEPAFSERKSPPSVDIWSTSGTQVDDASEAAPAEPEVSEGVDLEAQEHMVSAEDFIVDEGEVEGEVEGAVGTDGGVDGGMDGGVRNEGPLEWGAEKVVSQPDAVKDSNQPKTKPAVRSDEDLWS